MFIKFEKNYEWSVSLEENVFLSQISLVNKFKEFM